MLLYHCRDSRSLRPLWALEEAGLAYELVKMPFPPRYRFDGYMEVNPLGTVPTLSVGEATMTESSAMCHYIGEAADDASLRLAPSERDYPLYLNWLYRSDATLTFPLTLVLRYSRLEPVERRSPQVADDYRLWFLKRAKSVEQALERSEHLCADRFTMADVAVGYALYLADRLGVSGDFEPRTKAYLERLTARPAFARAIEKQSDMEFVV
jgi:glutathione S-transferase